MLGPLPLSKGIGTPSKFTRGLSCMEGGEIMQEWLEEHPTAYVLMLWGGIALGAAAAGLLGRSIIRKVVEAAIDNA